jgi:hypothetical protein
MNVQGVERIPDLVGHAGRQQGQRLQPLGLDGLEAVFSRASVASCRINARPELPAASPSSGAA